MSFIKKMSSVNKNLTTGFVSVLFSMCVLLFASGLKILSGNNTGWLTVEDGRAEISWEFFRRTRFPNWLFGEVYLYGMDSVNNLYFTSLPPLYALILRPFSSLLPDRFQFFGIMLLINLSLIYFISFKIFSYFSFSYTLSNLGSMLMVLSPLSLHRMIDLSHYVLTANWLILLAFYLIFQNKKNSNTWSLIFLLSILINAYYTFMLLLIYTTWMIAEVYKNKRDLFYALKTFLLSLGYMGLGLFVSGFFRDIEPAAASGYGYYKSNLLSLFNANGWSKIFPDFYQSPGDYEGFGYPGISFYILLFLCGLIYFYRKLLLIPVNLNFPNGYLSIFRASLILLFLSFSDRIDFLNSTLVLIPYPVFLRIL